MLMKNSSDTVGNRTRDLPACSPVPQPTAPPCAPIVMSGELEMISKVETVYGIYNAQFLMFWEGLRKNTEF